MSDLTIQGITFQAPDRYTEGHVMSAGEAMALNQTFHENLRNNFAARIKKVKDESGELTAEQTAQFIADFAAYAEDYEFAGRRTAAPRVDPVEREAMSIARNKLFEVMRAKGQDPKSLPKEKVGEVVAAILEKNPQIRELARERINAAKSLAIDTLDLAAA